MTHKEQFKAELEKVKLIIQSNRVHGAFAEGYLIGQESVLGHFENFVNSMQEEPVNKVDVDAAMAEVEAKAKTFTESHKGESSDKILAQMRGEEPVSEELEKAYTEYADERLELIRPDISDSSLSRDKKMSLDIFDGYCIEDAFEAGANWKEQQLEKNRLARCDAQTEEEAEREQEFVMQHIKKYHCQPTFSDAIEWGMNRQREQMTKNAIEGEWWRCAVVLPAKHMNTGDIRSVKIIIIED